MAFEVVYADDGFVECERERVRISRADQQCARQTRPRGDCERAHILQCTLRIRQHFLCQRNDALYVVARSEFGHNAAVGDVHVDLRVQGVGEQTARVVIQRNACFVARGFDT